MGAVSFSGNRDGHHKVWQVVVVMMMVTMVTVVMTVTVMMVIVNSIL